jgi:NAD(P)H-dependent FMN reductase
MRITIISGTNRKANKSSIFAALYSKLLTKKGVDNAIFDLRDFPQSFDFEQMYDYDNNPLQPLIERYIQPADALVFIIPEYNGSYPGVVKLLIDSIHPDYFKEKYASVIGIASGRAGNLRGIEHLNGVLQHLGVYTLPNVLPVSQIHRLLDNNNEVIDENTLAVFENDVDKLLAMSKK